MAEAANEKGTFTVLEGMDNSGKTTQSRLLGESLRLRGFKVWQTREPGGTLVGEDIRAVLLRSDRPKPIYPLAQTLLFYAARVEFLADEVRPRVEEGTHVIADRFNPSTHAYQGYAQGVSAEVLEFLDRKVIEDSGVSPDLCVILDISVEESIRRLDNLDNAGQVWAYERMGREFAELVRKGYLEYARRFNIPIIDGTKSRESIHSEMVSLVDDILLSR